MDFIRITNVNNKSLINSIAHYKNSFPYNEQREDKSQTEILNNKEYNFNIILDNDIEVGSILFWETNQYIYIEHFYIYQEFRGKSYGSLALNKLKHYNKKLILEIDPPIDNVSINRRNFYEKNEFIVNPFHHIHPPYHEHSHGHNLIIMSYPDKLSHSEYESFNSYLKSVVMNNVF